MKVVGKEFAVVCRLPAPASGLDYRELEGKPVRYRDMVIGEVDEVLEKDGEVCARLLIWDLT
ncbi:MAG: hypothetical protein KGL39_43140, partial [Patescibacteria group bacterium]|nr:hypothetical protein [Patescibacteria group bacterium]